MSRMLKALQQLESTRPAELPSPAEPVRGQNEMEATLATAERAVAEEVGDKAEGGKGDADQGWRKADEEETNAVSLPNASTTADVAQAIQPPPEEPSPPSPEPTAAAVETPQPSTPPGDHGERWMRFMADPARGATVLSEQPTAPDRSCVSPLLRSSIQASATGVSGSAVPIEAGATAGLSSSAILSTGGQVSGSSHGFTNNSILVKPAPAAETASQPAAPRVGLSKLAGHLKGEVADLGRIILGQLGLARPAVMLLASSEGEIRRGVSLLSLATMLGQQIEGELLLVGCDWQSKAAAERYGITAERGLVDLLAGGGRGTKAVQKVGRPPISVLLGRGYASPAQLPKNISWQSLIKQLKQRYSLLVLDASGLACAQAAPIARHCDGTYLLVIPRQTPRRAAGRAVNLLSSVNARLLGCVLVTG
jgi:Mrp family chromosome partitioning ATPase